MNDERMMPGESKDRGLPFVDTVRFWTMFTVVGGHCAAVFGLLGSVPLRLVQVLHTPMNFGTIGFFLISGLLLGNKLRTDRSMEYLRRRIKRLFVPWMLWYVVWLVVVLMRFHHDFRVPYRWNAGELRLVEARMYDCLFLSAFWFVPNLLLGICVLLIFRRWLYTWRLGAGLLGISLFYSVNIYWRWVPSLHMESVLGFAFYLWLGSWAATHRDKWMEWLERMDARKLVVATFIAACAAYGEARFLTGRVDDTLNVLRATNQVFAVLAVLFLIKMGRPRWSRFVNVRRETFGIYLTHTLVLATLLRLAQGGVNIHSWWRTTGVGLMWLWLVVFVATYGLSLGLTRSLLRWERTAWMVGGVD